MLHANYPFNDSSRHCRFGATSSEHFSTATIELCTRLWAELERMCEACDTDDTQSSASFAMRFEVLRLELLIILDRCAHRWTALLDHRQRTWLETLIGEVLATLDERANGLPDHECLMLAQNALLSAILDQCAEHIFEKLYRPMSGPRKADVHGLTLRF